MGWRRSVAVALLVAALTWFSLAAVALAASPSASPAAGGDPRSSGQGPGLVGQPLIAVGAVIAIGLLSLGLTFGWIRLTSRSKRIYST